MKKTIIFILSLLLFITPVTSLISGTNNTIVTLDKCDDLFVNVSGTEPIDDGEYNFPLCTLINDNYWYCDCSDDYELIIDLHILAHNNYTFDIGYYYEGIQQQTIRRSGGGGTVIREVNVTEECEECNVTEIIINETIIIEQEGNQTEQIINDTEEIIEEIIIPTELEERESIPLWFFILLGLVLLMIVFIAIYVIKKNSKEDDDIDIY